MPGRYFEELQIGDVIVHALGRTITEADNVLFCAITMNTQPLHLNEDYAARHSEFGQRLVNGLLTLALAVGVSVPELTQGTLVANLGYDAVRQPHPMFHGDTLYVETVVIDKRASRSRPDQGIVRFRHTGRNQNNVVVLEFERTALMLKKPGAP
jgi:acyl dehydratase